MSPTAPAWSRAPSRNTTLTQPGLSRNIDAITSGTVATPRSHPIRVRTAHDSGVRRLRDLLRAAILRGDYPTGVLPGESTLMAREQLSRATVREALDLLRHEGLVERTQGVGTHVMARAVMMRLAEMHGAAQPETASIFNRRMRPRILDCSVLPTPESVARRLEIPDGTDCLRLEYVALFGDEPVGIATNYVIFPEAERIRSTPFVSDWYALLADAGVDLGDSEVVLSCSTADPATADSLGVAAGTPLLSMEQIIHDADGRAFDLAFIHTRGDRFLLTSRIGRSGGGLRWLG